MADLKTDEDEAAPPTAHASAASDRRRFLARGAALSAGVVTSAAGVPAFAADTPAIAVPSWSKAPGTPMRTYGTPSRFEEPVKRVVASGYPKISPGTGSSLTPLQALEGTITPSGLHFERHHSGVPDIDPLQHHLVVHGLVKRPLKFSLETLLRYPLVTRTYFIECAGNSARNTGPQPLQVSCGTIHGLVSTSEWTGVPVAQLLEEAGLEPSAKWLLADGADSAAMSRSVPLDKALDDAIIALYQNGERLRPEQGYPMRLLLPGWEGNMNVKWLRQLKLVPEPHHTKDETSKYSDLQPDGKSRQFTFVLGVKSVITHPSFGMTMTGHGLYEISGLAWSGTGRITRVDVSTDGGATWNPARLQTPVLAKSVTRFRIPWEWRGQAALLQSRAIDEKGNVQPTRSAWNALYSPGNRYHHNAIQTWSVKADGSIANVYA
ncbi:MAG TPA: sulfite dehydrogenase [Burkholderiales bacterium]|nr:sulfite dehydrogenase [Burkholderiales bacterium]